MIEIKRSHLIAASTAPLLVVLAAMAVVVSRGPGPALPKPGDEVAAAPKPTEDVRVEEPRPNCATGSGRQSRFIRQDNDEDGRQGPGDRSARGRPKPAALRRHGRMGSGRTDTRDELS